MASGIKYSDEFQAEAMALVREGKFPAARIAPDLGISKDTLYVWVKKADRQCLSADQIKS